MQRAERDFLRETDKAADRRRQEILRAPDRLEVSGRRYYVSAEGDDRGDGLTPETAWRTLVRAGGAELSPGDGVLFRRGDLFRGQLRTRPGVSYGAYGEGEKPRIYSFDFDLADPSLWEPWDAERHIWRCRVKTPDAGTLVFNGGECCSRKLIPSYLGGRFVCRDAPDTEFDLRRDMTENLDLFCRCDEAMTTAPSRGESFPIPRLDSDSRGELYLRCDGGNPGECFRSIELLAKRHLVAVGSNDNVRIDNLCLRYGGEHAIAAGGPCVRGLRVTGCEIGWIGGCIQHYLGTDPNYPEGGRGTVTRYGNGVEIYGGCDGYEVSGCLIYQVYDAGITHQFSTNGRECRMSHVRYADNLIEDCVYSIEYFLEKNGPDGTADPSRMSDVEICGNLLRRSGYGWGMQRHNTDTPAHIKGWSYVNTADGFRIRGNLFDRASRRMLHLVAREESSLPRMEGNTYIQTLGGTLGQYGANGQSEPPVLPFDLHAEEYVRDILHDEGARVLFADDRG